MEKFKVSEVVANLGLALYVLGFGLGRYGLTIHTDLQLTLVQDQ
jgi:hypothetical protein